MEKNENVGTKNAFMPTYNYVFLKQFITFIED